MGIYIKDVNKPKECKRCRFTYIYEHPEVGDYEICQFIPDEPILPAGIDNRCPLIEVSTEALEQEPKRGKWIDHTDEGFVECPFCHSATNCEDNIDELKFCFSCGARMECDEQ